MVTGVVTTNMNPNVLGAVPTQLKETPLKSDRRVSVKKKKNRKKTKTDSTKAATTWIKRAQKDGTAGNPKINKTL